MIFTKAQLGQSEFQKERLQAELRAAARRVPSTGAGAGTGAAVGTVAGAGEGREDLEGQLAEMTRQVSGNVFD